MRADKYGRGPAATSCAFWNDFLPRLRNWGDLKAFFSHQHYRFDFYFENHAINFDFFLQLLIVLNSTMRDKRARDKLLS